MRGHMRRQQELARNSPAGLSLIGKLVVTLRDYTAMGTERQELLGKGFATDFSQRAGDAHSWWSRHRTSVDLVGLALPVAERVRAEDWKRRPLVRGDSRDV